VVADGHLDLPGGIGNPLRSMSVTTFSTRSARVLAAATVATLLFAACSDDGPDESSTATESPAAATETTEAAPVDTVDDAAPPNGEVVDVTALDNTFRPEEIEIVAGTTIRWENGGRNDHNVLPADETLDWGVDVADFAPGDDYSQLFDTPGVFPYYCSLHGTADFGMIGTIVVTG